jgi:C-terminal processing protease CtpA/Prc
LRPSDLKTAAKGDGVFQVAYDEMLLSVHATLSNENGKTLGYLALAEFSASSAEEIHDATSDLLSRNAQGFVLDLRNNPGDFVPASRDIANLFLGKQQRIHRVCDPLVAARAGRSGLIVAVAQFEAPNGTDVHRRGILPDYQVAEKEMDLGRQKAAPDPQYEMAVRVLLEKIAGMKES